MTISSAGAAALSEKAKPAPSQSTVAGKQASKVVPFTDLDAAAAERNSIPKVDSLVSLNSADNAEEVGDNTAGASARAVHTARASAGGEEVQSEEKVAVDGEGEEECDVDQLAKAGAAAIAKHQQQLQLPCDQAPGAL